MSAWNPVTWSARRVLLVAAGWTGLDVLLHVAADLVDPVRIVGNVVVLTAVGLALTPSSPLLRASACWAGVTVSLVLNALWAVVHGPAVPAAVLAGVAALLLGRAAVLVRGDPPRDPAPSTVVRVAVVTGGAAVTTVTVCAFAAASVLGGATKATLYDGRLVAADYFTAEPEILSAGLGFDATIGLPSLSEADVRAAGGAWASELDCEVEVEPDDAGLRTAAAANDGIDSGFHVQDGVDVTGSDGLPVVFSWPVRSDTLDPRQFRLTLTDGDVVVPEAAGLLPNYELNERQTVVLFGDFGDRTDLFPTSLEMVDADGPLLLAGPDGDVSATGLTSTTITSGYDVGPTLVAAKLTRTDPDGAGENGVFGPGRSTMPNDEIALYGDAADFRLRLITTGGFSPDGVRGLRPSMFADYFRLRATGSDGEVMELTETGVDYQVRGGTLTVLGLSDLGPSFEVASDDDCYPEDGDNQVDVILSGDDAAVRSLLELEMPGLAGGYEALYNPGGPGPTPDQDVVYTEPSPPLLLPIMVALDDPMQVTRD